MVAKISALCMLSQPLREHVLRLVSCYEIVAFLRAGGKVLYSYDQLRL